MSLPIIEVDNLSKRYQLGQFNAHTLRDEVEGLFRRRSDKGSGKVDQAEFWALRNITLSVDPGEVVGIIGRNGAGKSTLLKILSRVTEPTAGVARLRGRVASLLEVGTGFHPELTGRDNIYLNGAILGMTRAEIKAKFDEIVDFSGVEKFLDTPVKRYSSGMYVRLAFAVAAHLEPEILIVDEVLAVGDAEFQKKCLGKMGEVARGGRTVLFVSHNLHAVERLCSRAILIQAGRVDYEGAPARACGRYLGSATEWDFASRLKAGSRQGDGRARVTEIEVLNSKREPVVELAAGEPLRVKIRYTLTESIRSPIFGFALLTAAGVRVFNTLSRDAGTGLEVIESHGEIEVEISGLILALGRYLCNVSIADRSGHYCDYIVEVPLVMVVDGNALPNSRIYDQSCGVVYSTGRWTIVQNELQRA
jgi:lipopolysaccharide transport system ATP-binding protein